MSKYFRYYPQTQYAFANGSFTIEKSVKNISLKTSLINNLSQNDPYTFLRYTVIEDEKAEDIADFYYDDPAMSWLVYLLMTLLIHTLNGQRLMRTSLNISERSMRVKHFLQALMLSYGDKIQPEQITSFIGKRLMMRRY